MNASFKIFTFNNKSTREVLTVKIPELTDADYGLYIWPCAPVLAQYIWLRKGFITGKKVLEIGAGTALPGIVAAKCGAKVILSDSTNYPLCLDICHKSAELNDVTEISVVGITWGQVTSVLVNLPKLDIVLASDCFYDSKDFEDVVMTLSYVLHRNPNAEVWCTYQERSSERSIEHLLDKWELYGEEVDAPAMDTVTTTFEGHLLHVIKLFIIRLKKEIKPL
ncbi:unnamed protein product [Lymnaea stagnalis]|uniref:Methyltransferase-like protein 23 n=1 Tax=Lymnaea stagnalis TaxID=6523 RepID=A0AAV2I673_LYMST